MSSILLIFLFYKYLLTPESAGKSQEFKHVTDREPQRAWSVKEIVVEYGRGGTDLKKTFFRLETHEAPNGVRPVIPTYAQCGFGTYTGR